MEYRINSTMHRVVNKIENIKETKNNREPSFKKNITLQDGELGFSEILKRAIEENDIEL